MADLTFKDVWNKLSKIDVSEHIEQKMDGLNYLSWAWAWGTLMDNYPEAEFSFYEGEDRVPYVTLPDGTCEVRCRVTIGNLQREMWLPILSGGNKPIVNPNAFQVNTSKMRCLTKCLAFYGLGHYIYAGEDLPQDKEPEVEGKKVEPKKKAEPKKEPKGEGIVIEDETEESFDNFIDVYLQALATKGTVAKAREWYATTKNQEVISKMATKFPEKKEEFVTKIKEAIKDYPQE